MTTSNQDVFLQNGTYQAKLKWIRKKWIKVKSKEKDGRNSEGNPGTKNTQNDADTGGEEVKVHFLSWEVMMGPHKGEEFWTSFWNNNPKSRFPSRRIAKAMGIEKVGKKYNLVGHSCMVTIVQKKKPYHEGTGYGPIPE